MFSTFTATNPSIYLDIDRDKAQALGLNISDVFTALQATLGGIYVNNFNLFGRTWQVNIEGEAADRGDIPRHLADLRAQQRPARWCRCARSPTLRIVTGPQVITRYNNYRSVTINGGPAAGVSSGTALAAMEEISAKTLPAGYAYEWTGTAYQEQQAAGQTGIILALAMLFAYLFLVALYESWIIPIPVLLSVAVGVLGSFIGIMIAGLTLDLYAPDRPRGADRARRQERHPDRRIRQGAARGRACRSRRPRRSASQMRFRAVMMTSIAFILGLLPLVVATGAAQISRRGVGTAGVRRHAGGELDRHFPDPDAVRDVPAACASA